MSNLEIVAIADLLGPEKASTENICRYSLCLPQGRRVVSNEALTHTFGDIVLLVDDGMLEQNPNRDLGAIAYIVTGKGRLALGALKETLSKHTKKLAGKPVTW